MLSPLVSSLKQTHQSSPGFRWHDTWRNVKIDLSSDKLEASWSKGAHHRYWATFAADKILDDSKQHYMELEVVEFGKQKPQKKLAIGVIACSKTSASNLPWHEGQHPVGQIEGVRSWSFHPISGVKNSHELQNEGEPYADHISLLEGDRIGMLVDGPAKKLVFFLNGQDLGVAFEGLDTTALLPVVSIRDKIRVRLRFPPPPYLKRCVKLIQLRGSIAFWLLLQAQIIHFFLCTEPQCYYYHYLQCNNNWCHYLPQMKI